MHALGTTFEIYSFAYIPVGYPIIIYAKYLSFFIFSALVAIKAYGFAWENRIFFPSRNLSLVHIDI